MPYEMSLTHALLQSNHGIATRQVVIRHTKTGKPVYEYWLAVASQRGKVFIFNGRTGAMRKMFATDQLVTNWKPFMIDAPKTFRLLLEHARGSVVKGPVIPKPGHQKGKRNPMKGRKRDRKTGKYLPLHPKAPEPPVDAPAPADPPADSDTQTPSEF